MSAPQFSRLAFGIIDTVVNLWTAEALSFRPGWQAGYYVDKMRGQSADMTGLTLAQLIGMHVGIPWSDEMIAKVLFGTDFPVPQFQRTVHEIDQLGLRAGPDRKLMRDNAVQLFKLGI